MTTNDSPTTAEAQVQAEPTMEEILASIRKIIASDKPPESEPEPIAAMPADDVLDLTEMVDDVPPPPPEPEPVPEPEPAPPIIVETIIATPPPEPEPILSVSAIAKELEDKLISENSATASASAFGNFAQRLEQSRVSNLPTQIGNSQKTMEDLLADLLRPMLKDWLDKNLPATVEKMVQRELERIAQQGK